MAYANKDLFNEIKRVLKIKYQEIKELKPLDGSNVVFSFMVKNKKYVIRKLAKNSIINWRNEKAAYNALKHLSITDELVSYENGIKIAVFLNDGKILSYSEQDQIDSLEALRKIHDSGASINFNYDIIGNIEKYALQCDSELKEIKELKNNRNTIDKIDKILNKLNIPKTLCHGDACVNGNMLRLPDNSIRIIDWEQTGMADPFLDIAISALHQGFYNIDPACNLHHYLKRRPEETEYLRLYSYLALDSFALMAWCLSCNNFDDYYDYKTYAQRYSGLVLKYYI